VKTLLDAEEMGAVLKVEGATVRKWARKGIITPAVAVGTVVRFDAEKVLAELAENAAERAGKSGGRKAARDAVEAACAVRRKRQESRVKNQEKKKM
jgi:hypothetical protein